MGGYSNVEHHLIELMRHILIIAVLVSISSCDKVVEKDIESIFDPVVEIRTSDLIEEEYRYLDEWTWYQKLKGDTAFLFHTNFEEDPVFTRIIDIDNFGRPDSAKLYNFVRSKGGLLASMPECEGDYLVFFVQGQRCGLYSKCFIVGDHLQIVFQFPDTDDINRSNYRIISDGELVTKITKGADVRSFRMK